MLLFRVRTAQATAMDVLLVEKQDISTHMFGTFDVIFNAMMLHHIEVTLAMFKRWYSLLSKNGRLFAADLDKEDGTFHRSPVNVHHGFERETLGNIAVEAGFRNIEFNTVCSLERISNEGVKRIYPLFLMTADK